MSGRTHSRSGPIYLVGMMGVGKSTIGPLLARRLGRAFVDSDAEVERAEGQSIAAIFATHGEAHFRRLEREVIERNALDGPVMALGGGAIAQAGACDRLRATGTLVFLEAPVATLLERIGDASSRPLLAGLDENAQRAKLVALLAERMPYYARAHHRIDADAPAAEVVARIEAAMGLQAEERTGSR